VQERNEGPEQALPARKHEPIPDLPGEFGVVPYSLWQSFAMGKIGENRNSLDSQVENASCVLGTVSYLGPRIGTFPRHYQSN
jgi:hypothetical protein